jgi:hypothetical protein
MDVGNTREVRKDEVQDLTSILDRHQRADFTMLITQIMESMHKGISDNFDLAAPGNPNPSRDVQRSGERISGDAGPRATVPQVAGPQAARRSLLREKAEALRYFNDWRESVLARIGEVVNQRDGSSQKRQQGPSQLQRRPPSQEMSAHGDPMSTRLREIYPPLETPLSQLPRSKKLVILDSLLLLLLSLKHYSAHSRVLLLFVASSLDLSLVDLNRDEAKVARGLLDAAVMMSAEEETKKRSQENSNARKWKVGLAAVAGAALIGVTGGLAAPLVAAGLGSLMSGIGLGAVAAFLGPLATSSVLVGGLFGAYGGRMTGRMMDKYAREVEDFAFIPTRGPKTDFKDEKDAAKQDHRLRVTIGITGWAREEGDMVVPWRVIGADSEVFALRWEVESLLHLGGAMRELVTSAAWAAAGRVILSPVLNALMLPMTLLRLVDNPFSVAKARADKAGEVLADALINKAQGERPVTLIGYSLGSRVVYSCLRSLARRRAYGLVETAILMGSPVPSDSNHWRMMRSVVSGRLVNVFSETDAVLAFLYRASSAQLGIAGLHRIEAVPGVENVDASELVSGHLRYQFLLGKVLTNIGFEDIDAVELHREELALQIQDQEVEQERARNERRHKRTKEETTTPTTPPQSQEEMTKDFDSLNIESGGNGTAPSPKAGKQEEDEKETQRFQAESTPQLQIQEPMPWEVPEEEEEERKKTRQQQHHQREKVQEEDDGKKTEKFQAESTPQLQQQLQIQEPMPWEVPEEEEEKRKTRQQQQYHQREKVQEEDAPLFIRMNAPGYDSENSDG